MNSYAQQFNRISLMFWNLTFLAAAEGAFLGTYYYDMFKNEKKPAPELKCYTTFADSADRYLS